MKVYNETSEGIKIIQQEIDVHLWIVFEMDNGQRIKISEGHDNMLNINTVDSTLSIIPRATNSADIKPVSRI